MSAADKRVAELLERWMTSVDLHARYLALDDAAYASAQDWPKHQRPTRWVVDLARTRLTELGRIVADRRSRGDAGFAEALELMAFLTNLLGSEHVERFIPLAQPPAARQRTTAAAAAVEPTVEARVLRSAPAAKAARRTEPPRGEPRQAPATRAGRTAAPASKRAAAPAPRRAPPGDEPPVADRQIVATVIADAARLMSWGREWPQLAGLIARLANRPSEAEVWKILRAHRADIEARARQPRD
jgi:hypothetical protein